jgi:hypothetical protein
MRYLFILPTLLLLSCSTAQTGGPLDAAQLLTTHFGAKPTGTPLGITWKPTAQEYKHFVDLPIGTEVEQVRTTVDTILYPSPNTALVFFRTAREREEGTCWLCEDWLGLAVYTKNEQEWKAENFTKWFAKQGMYDLDFGLELPEPVLMEMGQSGRVVKIISSDGEPQMNTSTHRLYRIPEMKEVMVIVTGDFMEDHDGPHGPMLQATTRAYRLVPSSKPWYDVEVFRGDESGVNWEYIEPGAVPDEYFIWSDAKNEYVSSTPKKR